MPPRIGIDLDGWAERVLVASEKAIGERWGSGIGDKLALALEAARRGRLRVVDPIRRKKR